MTSRVLVLSDTHLRLGSQLPTAVLLLADRCDLIVHAGDASSVDVLDTLAALAPIHAVRGNADDAAVADRLDEVAQFEQAGVCIGVVHDPGPAHGREARLVERLSGSDVIVYGHTHEPHVGRTSSGVLIINPGSATQRRRAPWNSVCWLELDRGAVASCELVNIDTMSAT